MNEFNNLLKLLQELKITQTSGEWEENIPVKIWEKHFKGNFKELRSNLYIGTHRWYETSTIVIEIYGNLLGINYVSNILSESMMCEDCCHIITFTKMKEVPSTTYEYI